MYLTALIIDCAIARLYRHNGAMNMSVKLEPGTTEWKVHVAYAKLQLRVFGKDCSSAEIATCLGVFSYRRLKRAPLSSSLY